MKAIRMFWPLQGIPLAACLILGVASSGLAQTNYIFPVVTIRATDPFASWSGDTGTFTLFRAGSTNQTLNVYYQIAGTASNGVDYVQIPNWAIIPAGQSSSSITITPINKGQTMTETVVLQLAQSPAVPPVNYMIGCPSNATVYISPPNMTNIPPTVKITSPSDGATFFIPTNLQLFAVASDVDGFATSVQFFAGTNSLGIVTNFVILDPLFCSTSGGRGFFLTWSNVPPGKYPLTALATDNGGASTLSDPVNISVLQGPPTNIPPTVSILIPTNGQSFTAPANITICADARDADGYITTVEFFAGTNSIGIRTNCPACAGPMNPFCLTWPKVPMGQFVLTAKATDNGGASTVSDPVTITVQPGPPPTNLPPVVRIISPPNGAIFRAPVNIPIYAYANDLDGSISSVEFFAGSNSLGFGNPIICTNPICTNCLTPIRICPTNIYFIVWSNAPLGTYPLTAVATDNGGATTVSAPVSVSILPPPPPLTNRPPIVNIVATDPLAIEGTNCWTWPGMTNPTPTWSAWSPTLCRMFTNCGPKDATFTIHRFGLTNDALTVNYAIGGTATNGVDYVALSGSATFAPGEHSALITVVPIDDGPPDITSTVVLKLVPSTNYVVGFPAAAAAVILDGIFPLPSTGLLPGNCFHLNAAGPNGAWFRVQSSTDLVNWTTICTNQVFNGSIDFIDPDTQSDPTRLYRAVPQTTAP